jgi:hypothetical protein
MYMYWSLVIGYIYMYRLIEPNVPISRSLPKLPY